MRDPAVFWEPGLIKPDAVLRMGSTTDIFPTFSKLTGLPVPTDRIYDGYDLSGVLLGKKENPRNEMFFYMARI